MRCMIALGSNIGDRESYLASALEKVSERVGDIIKRSSVIETRAYGFTEQDDFLNMVIEVETGLKPDRLLDTLLAIETGLGRVRTKHWGPRTIDLDIIYLENEIIDTERLKVPHPDLHNRDFVLVPLSEIAPDFKDPVRGVSVADMLKALR